MNIITNIDIDNTLNLLNKGDYGVVMEKLLEYAKDGSSELVYQRLNYYGELFVLPNRWVDLQTDGG